MSMSVSIPNQFGIMFPELNTVMSISSLLLFAMSSKDEAQTFPIARNIRSSKPPQENSQPSHNVKYFNPHPSQIVSGMCSFKYFINKVPNRIPGMICL